MLKYNNNVLLRVNVIEHKVCNQNPRGVDYSYHSSPLSGLMDALWKDRLHIRNFLMGIVKCLGQNINVYSLAVPDDPLPLYLSPQNQMFALPVLEHA